MAWDGDVQPDTPPHATVRQADLRQADVRHDPVLLAEVLDLLAPVLEHGGWCVDVTLGLGGHAAAVLERFPNARLVGCDRDPRALELAAERLRPFGDRAVLCAARFSELEARIGDLGVGPVRGVVADLGVSSMQIDLGERGFSFSHDGPLDMRMGAGSAGARSGAWSPEGDSSGEAAGEELTAADVVNGYAEAELAQIFNQYGEERHARRIARGIVEERRQKPIESTGELARLVARLKPDRGRPRSGRRPLHPATQVFQALRMEVNQEIDELHALLDQSVRILEQEGRLVVISYHSGEDRVVKHTLRDLATGQIDKVTGRPRAETQVIEVLTKKPVRPSDQEVAQNPRARSARLRAGSRI